MSTSFAGKNIVITGAGSGFGLAAARQFAAGGARIIAVDRNADKLAGALAGLLLVLLILWGSV